MSLLSKETVFDVKINDAFHVISFYKEKGKYYLHIDGDKKETFSPESFLAFFFGDINDFRYEFRGTPIVIAVRYGRVRLAVNGKYTDNGAEFVAVKPVPIWAAVFIIAILLPPLYLGVPMLDLLISIMFTYTCTHYIIKNPDIKATRGLRIFYCVLVTFVSWLSLWIFNYL